jgi:hypothetical protein
MIDAALAVERLGQYAGSAGLAHPSCARKQKGVSDTPGIDGVLQGAADMLLAGQLRK